MNRFGSFEGLEEKREKRSFGGGIGVWVKVKAFKGDKRW